PEVEVKLLSDDGGRRIVVHAGGDAMFGRRFEEPSEGTPLISKDRADTDARQVVQAVSRVFRMADVSTLNLETVVTTRSFDFAYPKKRFLLRSPPDALAALDELGVDAVTLANNHSRDFLDSGVEDTRQALTARGLPFVGAASEEEHVE